jgi:hypothetical protein
MYSSLIIHICSNSRLFYEEVGGVNSFCTQINLSENYFFVGRHCSRQLHEKGVGGYMRRTTSKEIDVGDFRGCL